MVSIDTVYQRVLALANKEQRGYITPQEFNLFANQAQMDIFEQYFYDLNQFARIPGNEYVYADADNILEEKLQIFENEDTVNISGGYTVAGSGGAFRNLPERVYRVHRIELEGVNCEIQKTRDFNSCLSGGPLTKPTNARPIANIRDNIMRVFGDNGSAIQPTTVFYFRKPTIVNWSSYQILGAAAYDSTNSVNFELHPSEETKLVIKILGLAGITLKDPTLYQVAIAEDNKNIQQEKQ